MSGRFQRFLLTGQISDWETIQAGVPQGSSLRPLFFIIYINDLKINLKSNVKLFADDTSLFSEICNTLETPNVLTNDLQKICECAKQWKMSLKKRRWGLTPWKAEQPLRGTELQKKEAQKD